MGGDMGVLENIPWDKIFELLFKYLESCNTSCEKPGACSRYLEQRVCRTNLSAARKCWLGDWLAGVISRTDDRWKRRLHSTKRIMLLRWTICQRSITVGW